MGKNEEKKENVEKKETEKTIILKALVHCEGCSDKICKCLKGLAGVKQVQIDKEQQRVIVKGEAVNNPSLVLERLQKKYSKNVELISPKPKPKPDKQKNIQEKKEQVKIKTVVLKIYIHCEGCVRDVKNKIEKMEGVDSVEVDKENSLVIVKGTVEGAKLVEAVKKKLSKHAEIMKEEIRREPRKEVNDNEKRREPIIIYSYPPQYATQHIYPNQTFNDENVFACSVM